MAEEATVPTPGTNEMTAGAMVATFFVSLTVLLSPAIAAWPTFFPLAMFAPILSGSIPMSSAELSGFPMTGILSIPFPTAPTPLPTALPAD